MKNNVRKITIVGVLSALSVVLMIFPKFSLIPAFPFLEVDFSDVISLFAAACLSPSAGVLVVLIKNAVHLLMTSTGAVGELSNFICGASFVFAFGSVFHRAALSKNKYLHLLLSLIVGCAVQIIAAVLGNYFLMIPLYGIQAAAGSYIFGGVIPFNFVKDLLVSIVFAVVYLNVYPHIDRYVSRNP